MRNYLIVFFCSLVKDAKAYWDCMKDPELWISEFEFRAAALYIEHTIVIVTPISEHGNMEQHYYLDVYEGGSRKNPPLFIKSLPGHFQVFLLYFHP